MIRKRCFQSTNLFERDRSGKSALHYSSTSDNIRAAQAADLLVMAAPDLIETHDEDGFTPLHLAVIAGNMQLVTFLLANNADVNALDNEKHTVVHWATGKSSLHTYFIFTHELITHIFYIKCL